MFTVGEDVNNDVARAVGVEDDLANESPIKMTLMIRMLMMMVMNVDGEEG